MSAAETYENDHQICATQQYREQSVLAFNECTDTEHAFIELWEFTATEHTTQ